MHTIVIITNIKLKILAIIVMINSAFQEILGGTSFYSSRTSPVEFTSTGAEGVKFFNIL